MQNNKITTKKQTPADHQNISTCLAEAKCALNEIKKSSEKRSRAQAKERKYESEREKVKRGGREFKFKVGYLDVLMKGQSTGGGSIGAQLEAH